MTFADQRASHEKGEAAVVEAVDQLVTQAQHEARDDQSDGRSEQDEQGRLSAKQRRNSWWKGKSKGKPKGKDKGKGKEKGKKGEKGKGKPGHKGHQALSTGPKVTLTPRKP